MPETRVLLENAEQWRKIAQERARLPRLRHVVMMRGAERVDDPQVITWGEFQSRGSGVADADVEQRLNALQPDQLGTLIYTSGTTGPPKGCVLTHGNYRRVVTMLESAGAVQEEEVTYLFLPLAHAYALLIQLVNFDVGTTIAYYGDAARVREGFAIALELLGLNAPMVDDVTRAQSEDGE